MPPFEPSEEVLGRSASYLVWGSDRLPVEVLAFGLADRIDPEFQWVTDLCGSNPDRGHPLGPVGELVPSERRVVVGFLEEQFTVPEHLEHSIRSMVRSKPFDPGLVRLTTFAALPRALQVALGRVNQGPRPSAVVLADGHHLKDRWVDSVFAEPLFHSFLRTQNTSLLVTFLSEPPEAVRARFDHVYHVEVAPGAKWLRAKVRAQSSTWASEGPTAVPGDALSLGPFSEAVLTALARRGRTTAEDGSFQELAAP